MIRLYRTKVKTLAKWGQYVQKAFPDLNAFLAKAGDFEKLGIDDCLRRLGFAHYAGDVLLEDKKGARYFKAIWNKAKPALAAMSHQKCAYCETPINAKRSGQVEHFKPKSLFPLLVYVWDNYFLGCGGCNGEKFNKWPYGGIGYVRPDEGDPFSLFRFLEDGTVEAVNPAGAAQYTVDDLALNREWLRRPRALVIEKELAELQDLIDAAGIPEETLKELAKRKYDRLLNPELAYSAALRQSFVRAWQKNWPDVPL